uniref:non-specific serine/threonine protein kinase n=1 Tax=Fagus sylvatica TaxID=28930 RepID=A0A2N9H8V4_FAGSY
MFDGKDMLIVQIYVDDIIFGSTNENLCKEFSKTMQDEFEMSMMGELKFFLGLQIKQTEEGIFLNQSKYVIDLLKRFGLANAKAYGTPMSPSTKLDKDEKGKPVDVKLYRVKRIFRYLLGTIDLGLWYPKSNSFDLISYTDADFAGCKIDRKSTGGVPKLKSAKRFSFEELKKYTNNFSEGNSIGSGGYGKVYKSTLPTGELIAIKRAQRDSLQGGLEFKTEIELLSRVHHKNLVSLVGFCFEQGEQMLVYEYIPNGTLMDSLSGKSGIRLDWMGRLKATLGAARGLVYLHEHANPSIIHRDIKSNNILLDESFNAKVADFGLSKSELDSERNSVTTEVKGTLGYLDPEYYMTQQLTKKSDVYSFGVVMLELITARRPIERGKYIVGEVRKAMDKTKDLDNLHEIIDPFIGLGKSLKGLEEFVDLAMRCVEESGDKRPTMDEVVKEIEKIMQLAGMNLSADSEPSPANYVEVSKVPITLTTVIPLVIVGPSLLQ